MLPAQPQAALAACGGRLDDALLQIEGEVDRLEQIARAADKRVAALEARAKILTERSPAAIKP